MRGGDYMKIQKIAAGIVAAGAGLLMAVFPSFAAAPTPDAGVVTATSDVISGLQGAGISGLTTLLPIAGVLIVTAALVFWVFGHFRALTHI